MMQTFRESNIEFQFGDKWRIIKFDEHRYYRLLAGRGFSGVDFLGIYDEKEVYFIEIKNYLDQYQRDDENPWTAFSQNPDHFLQPIEKKFRDSERLVGIIIRYLRRKWWFRWIEKRPSLPLCFPFLKKREWYFWWQVYLRIQDGRISHLLYIKTDASLYSDEWRSVFERFSFGVIGGEEIGEVLPDVRVG